jgi:hypothetical protein
MVPPRCRACRTYSASLGSSRAETRADHARRFPLLASGDASPSLRSASQTFSKSTSSDSSLVFSPFPRTPESTTSSDLGIEVTSSSNGKPASLFASSSLSQPSHSRFLFMLIQIIRLHARQLARSDVLRLPSDRCARTRWKDGLNWLAMVSGLSTLLGFLPDAHASPSPLCDVGSSSSTASSPSRARFSASSSSRDFLRERRSGGCARTNLILPSTA